MVKLEEQAVVLNDIYQQKTVKTYLKPLKIKFITILYLTLYGLKKVTLGICATFNSF